MGDRYHVHTHIAGDDLSDVHKGQLHKGVAGIQLFPSCLSRDAVMSVEDAVLRSFEGEAPEGVILRTDNGPQYNS